MAEIDPAIVNALNEALKNGGINASQLAQTMSAMKSSVDAANRAAAGVATSFNNASQSSRQMGQAAAQGAGFIKSAYRNIKDLSNSADEANEEFAKLKNSIASQIADPKMRASFIRFADAQADAADRTEAWSRNIAAISRPISAIGGAAMSLVQTYQGGSGQIGLASKALEIELSLAGQGLKAFGGMLSSAGQALNANGILTGNPILGGFGAVVDIVGKALNLAGAASENLAKVQGVLSSEIKNTMDQFQSLSSSGAIFGQGLMSMVVAAGKSGLSLGQLDTIVKSNKENLADFGKGVAGGVDMLVDSLRSGGDGFRKRLLNLGYSVEEQAALMTDVMAQMRRSGREIPNNAAGQAMLAQETAKYAENLRIISSITGEDARAKQKVLEQQNQELAFQQVLNQMGPTQAAKVEQAMLLMSESHKRAYREQMVFGRIISTDLAATAQRVPAFGETIDRFTDLTNRGVMDSNATLDVLQDTSGRMREQVMSDKSIGFAGMARTPGVASDVAKNLGDLGVYTRRVTPDAIAESRERVARQAAPPQPGEKGFGEEAKMQNAMIDAIMMNQQMNVDLNQTILNSTGLLTNYMKLLKEAGDVMLKTLHSLPGIGGGEYEISTVPGGFTNYRRRAAGELGANERARAVEQQDREEGAGINQRTNPVQGTYPAGRRPGDPGFVPQPGDLVGANLDRIIREQRERARTGATTPGTLRTGATPGATVAPSTPTPTSTPGATVAPSTPTPTSTPGPQSTGPINNANDAFRAASLYHQGPTMPTGEELARQQAEQRQAAAEQDDQEQGRIIRENAARNRNASANDTVTGMDRLTTAMNSVRDVLDESVRHLANIENYTKQSALNA